MSEERAEECLIALKTLEVSGLKEMPPRVLRSTGNSCQLPSMDIFLLSVVQGPALSDSPYQRMSRFKGSADM